METDKALLSSTLMKAIDILRDDMHIFVLSRPISQPLVRFKTRNPNE
jgi:hypothetical protein